MSGENTTNKKTNTIIGIAAVAIVAIIAIIIILAVSSSAKKTIPLNDYLTIEINGYDTVGNAYYKLDTNQIFEDYADALDVKDEFDEVRKMVYFEEYVSGKLDKTTELKNGDTVTFTWKVDEETLKEALGCKVKYSEVKEKVSTLEELAQYDPFEDLVVTFDGISPNGTVKIDSSNVKYYYINFEADRYQGLKNGDKIKISVQNPDNLKRISVMDGIMVSKLEQEYTVEGLNAYVTQLSEIPQESLDKMKSQSEDALKSYVAQNWGEAESLKGMTFLGNYFLISKGNNIYGNLQNYLYNVYKVDVANSEGEFSYYWYTTFDTLMLLNDGTFSVDLNKYKVPEGSAVFGKAYGECFFKGSYYYKGYETLDSLFNNCVTSNIDKYTYESTVTEQYYIFFTFIQI